MTRDGKAKQSAGLAAAVAPPAAHRASAPGGAGDTCGPFHRPDGPLFQRDAGRLRFRGLPVERTTVAIGGRRFYVVCLEDAADLLDQPDFARKFIEQDRAPYGLELWPAAVMLAESVLAGEHGRGRTAVELGCGLGLVSLAATVRGWNVIATDHEETALRFAEYVARLNGIRPAAFEFLDWRHPPAGRKFDLILGADLLYQLVDHQPILRCVRQVMAADGSALLTDPNRSVADGFAALAGTMGFGVRTAPCRAEPAGSRGINGRVFELRRS